MNTPRPRPTKRPPTRRLGEALRAATCLAGGLGLLACGSEPTGSGSAAELVLAAKLEEARAENAQLAAERDRLEAELARERRALAGERAARTARETDWLEYTRALASLDVEEVLRELQFAVHLPQVEEAGEPEPEPDPEAERRRERAEAIRTSMRTMLRLEEVRALDLLEVGELGEGFVGPAIFRLLDERGRLMGSLYAERLSLESSRSAHTVTLVLEEGYESRGGVRTPFAHGVRRIVLPHVDPQPWREAMGEIFPESQDLGVDDGQWNLARLQRDLNERLRFDADGAYYQLKRLGGVWEDALTEVQLVQFDAAGRIASRLFADRLRIVPRTTGVQLVLEDGASTLGDEKRPFVDGRYRIFLPGADPELWRSLALPGVTPPEASAPEAAGSS